MSAPNYFEKILEEEVTVYTNKEAPTIVYVEYPRYNESLAFEAVGSKEFLAFLGYRQRKLANSSARLNSKPAIENRIEDAIYTRENPVLPCCRVTGSMDEENEITPGIVAYDLANEADEKVFIDSEGWELCDIENLKFLRPWGAKAQVTPVSGGDLLKLLRPHVNLKKDDFILFVCNICQYFIRESSHFATVISSAHGTGKTHLTKIIRELVDPSEFGVSLTPKSDDDLKVSLSNCYLATFDNTEVLKNSFSDILCAAITGSKDTKRQLFKDADLVILSLHNAIVLNGINIIPPKSDLLERSLVFELRPIPAEKRKTDAELWAAFKRDKPAILGAMFDTLAKAIALYPTIQRNRKLQRMADANFEMLAIAKALGIEEDEFQSILNTNRSKIEDFYAEINPLVNVVADFMHNKARYEGTAKELYVELSKTEVGRKTALPGSESILSRRLDEERDALKAVGIEFSRDKVKGSRKVVLRRV